MINLKQNFWIKGFDTEGEAHIFQVENDLEKIIYLGKSLGISEELADKCAEFNTFPDMWLLYDNPSSDGIHYDYRALTAKRSILSAVTKPNNKDEFYNYMLIWEKDK